MALTPELVACVTRPVAQQELPPGVSRYTDAEHAAKVDEVLASHPEGEDLWLFAYGSLIWRPEVEHVEVRVGVARGWHRSFCFRISLFRASPEEPGFMMALDRGGQSKGVLYRLPADGLRAQVEKLIRREMPIRHVPDREPTNVPRWIRVATETGPMRALAFVANPRGAIYCGRRPLEEVADALATACGSRGSCAEYLYNTIVHLEEHGIHDRNLWRLQALVAERIAARFRAGRGTTAEPAA